jgi:uncharacterized NAD(P)/FAD-binding protein YdhS
VTAAGLVASLDHVEIAIVGAGPRGVSLLERIGANVAVDPPGVPVSVHLIDPYPPGPGQVWRTDQAGALLMNTVASQVTLFTDPTVEMQGPVVFGPSLHEWAKHLRLRADTEVARYTPETLDEADALTADAYSSRAFYGHYLEWVYRRVVESSAGVLRVVWHPMRAVGVEEDSYGQQAVVLSDGTRLANLAAVVLVQGHLPSHATAEEQALTDYADEHGLTYVHPANPADADLNAIGPGQAVGLRGLGLSFFDYLALFTLERGGRFEERDGKLVYLPSGREPLLYGGSRRGVPYHARGENEKGPHGRHVPRLLTAHTIAALRRRAVVSGGLDFRRDIWPLIAKEVESVYYTALLRSTESDDRAELFHDLHVAYPWGGAKDERVLEVFGVAAKQRWDWERLAHPQGSRTFAGPADFTSWLVDYLNEDLEYARAGNVSGPLKAALDVLRDLRNEVRLLVDHGGLRGSSHRDDLERWFTPMNAYFSIGPPVSRVEQMIALLEAGVLRVVGPRMLAGCDPGGQFFVESPDVPGSRVIVTALVDARLPEPDLRTTADPLLARLLRDGECHPFRIADPSGPYETGGLAVTDRPYHVLDQHGRAHPSRFAFGVPTEAVHWVTAAGARPYVNSASLGDADSIARAVLAIVREAGRLVPSIPVGRTP